MRVSNNLDPDQERHSVVPDLGPNGLQNLSADGDSHLAKKELTNKPVFLQIRIEMLKERSLALKEQEERLGTLVAGLQLSKAKEVGLFLQISCLCPPPLS